MSSQWPCVESLIPLSPCSQRSPTASFDTTPSPEIIAFEAFTVVGTLVALYLLSRLSSRVPVRYLVIVLGVFVFEFFTGPMWRNYHLGQWAYVHHDVSWLLTLGWSTMILSVVLAIDRIFRERSALRRFVAYLFVLTLLVYLFETIVVRLGIRSYSPEVMATLSGHYLLGLPIEALYYVPVFASLVIAFYKYWSLAIDDRAMIPMRRRHWVRDFLIAFLAVFAFELMIEPMVLNSGLPNWSYVFRDISFLMTGGWVLVIWLGTSIVDRLLKRANLVQKFLGFMVVVALVATPIETWLIANGFRVYGPTATAEFSGFTLPAIGTPVEVAFGIPFYLALVIAFIKYWQTALDNRW